MTEDEKISKVIEALRGVIEAVSILGSGADWKQSAIVSKLADAEYVLDDVENLHPDHPVDCLCDLCYDRWKGVCPGCFGENFKAYSVFMDSTGEYSCADCRQVWRTKREGDKIVVQRMKPNRGRK